MNMKKILLTLAVALTALFVSNAEEVTKTKEFGDITRIDIAYLYEVHITEGSSGQVRFVYDSAYENHLKIRYDKNNSELNLELQDLPKKFKLSSEPKILVYLEMDQIDKLSLSGACKAVFDGSFTTKDIHIDLSGAAQLSGLDIKGSSMKFCASGACKAGFSGDFRDEAEVELSGAARCDLNIYADNFEGELSGAAKIELDGKVKDLSIEGSGACSIDAEDFVTTHTVIELSGASKAKIYAEKTLTYNVSRASKLIHYGDAKLIDKTEASNVVRGI